MNCTKCETKTLVEKKAKKNKVRIHNPNLLSRVIYENVLKLESFSPAPSGKSEINNQNSEKSFRDLPPKELIVEYEKAFKEEIGLRLSKIEKFEDIENIRQRLWRVEDNRRMIEQTYTQTAKDDPYPEETLLKARIATRKSLVGDETHVSMEYNPKKFKRLMKEINSQLCSGGKKKEKVVSKSNGTKESPEEEYEDEPEEEMTESDLDISQLIGKSEKEQTTIIKNYFPELDDDMIKSMIIGEE